VKRGSGRSTRLFGYDGCDSQAAKIINAAYDDFYKLSHLDGLYANFDWKGQASREFWGSDVSPKAPLDDVSFHVSFYGFLPTWLHYHMIKNLAIKLIIT
jgi:hypothetical protein